MAYPEPPDPSIQPALTGPAYLGEAVVELEVAGLDRLRALAAVGVLLLAHIALVAQAQPWGEGVLGAVSVSTT